MATMISDDCIFCDQCVDACPNGAITDGSDVGKDIYFIHPHLCTECVGEFSEEQCQVMCPVECCIPNPDIVEDEATLAARALAIHPDDKALAARIASGNFPSLKRK
jgi:ferredoxin